MFVLVSITGFCTTFQVQPTIHVDCLDLTLHNSSPYWNKKQCCQEADKHTLSHLCREINATTLGNESRVPGCSCIDLMACKTVVLVAISSNHWNESLDAIGSIQNMMPNTKIIVLDLGMWKSQIKQTQRLRNVEIVKFPFDAFPPHVQTLMTYAWKPIAIQMILSKYEVVLYLDASIRLTSPLVRILPDLQYFPFKIYSISRYDGAYTMEETYEYLKITRKQVSKLYQKETGFQLYRNCSLLHERILSHFVDCALHEECIAPPGSSPFGCDNKKYEEQVENIEKIDVIENIGCHRFDQSAMTSILEREFHLPNDSPIVDGTDSEQMRIVLRDVTKCFTLYLDY